MTRPRGQLNPHLSQSRLAYFLAVYDHGGLNRAALSLGISQQALSKSLRKLEESLDVSLFERTAFGVQPTIYGQRLADRARTILAESKMAAAEVEALRGFRSGLVRLGVGPSLAGRRAPRAVAELRRRLPDVGVSVIVGNTEGLFPLLMHGELDLIVSAPVPTVKADESLVYQPFGIEHDEVVGRAGHPLRKKAKPHLRDFSAYSWVGEDSTSHVIRRASQVFIQAGLPPFVDVITTNSTDVLKYLLISTDTLSLLHPEFYFREREAGLIAPFNVPEFKLRREVRLYRRRASKASPAVRLMTEILIEQLSK